MFPKCVKYVIFNNEEIQLKKKDMFFIQFDYAKQNLRI